MAMLFQGGDGKDNRDVFVQRLNGGPGHIGKLHVSCLQIVRGNGRWQAEDRQNP